MTEKLTYLWDMLTIFFSDEVFTNELFLGLILLTSVFAVLYIFMWFLDSNTWGW